MDALRRLDMTAMRYPGGNFASGYHWQDGVGPREQRPTVRELAWQSIEPNRFGTDEYHRSSAARWTGRRCSTVNLGTGTPEEARNWVEYCNCPTGTRTPTCAPPTAAPSRYGVKLWCLGNEMDGPWQLGPRARRPVRHPRPAGGQDDEGRRPLASSWWPAAPAASACRPTWSGTAQVLEYLGDLADYISLHRYVGNPEDDTPDYLAVTNSHRPTDRGDGRRLPLRAGEAAQQETGLPLL